MLKRRYKSKDNRENRKIDWIRMKIESLKEEENLLRKRMEDLEGDPVWPYLTERLSSVEQKIKKLQLEEKRRFAEEIGLINPEEGPSEDPDEKGTETKKFPKLMEIVNEKSQYYGQEVKPLKELNYGDKVVIQVKLENGTTEIFDPQDLTEI